MCNNAHIDFVLFFNEKFVVPSERESDRLPETREQNKFVVLFILSGISGGENEQENTLIQLLVEMDGRLIVTPFNRIQNGAGQYLKYYNWMPDNNRIPDDCRRFTAT